MWALRLSAIAGFGTRRTVHSTQYLRCINQTAFTTSPLIAPFTSSALDICPLPQAVKRKVDIILNGVGDKDTVEDVKRVLEMANRASLRRVTLHTDFLTPPVLKESMLALEKIADIKMAERCRLSVGHPDVLTSDPDIVAALSHGDFLGAILGTGIVRDKLGDIILQGENGAQVLVVPELVDILVSSLDKVRNVSITCKKIPLLALEYQPPRTKSLKTVEASQRLDAIASAGFKISRSKMADLISNGDVRVNWCTVTKSNTTLKPGDLISVSGKGRLKVGEINSTRKGKFAVELIRFL
ncbi:putative RNA-binding protein YlmH isoform X4 [Salvia splendens]|uniref:putative RNA-binding protein YlmH isoform X4 n=1 Tax=Salvia splendens TaxID=180675 RepID=UPI001C26FD7D|nr:putative RNA-binding protein YlmH isoform X4 [Salvia splendens]